MRIITLNVNGIRSAHQKGFWQWVQSQSPDVICLQEIKAHEPMIPEECRAPKGFYAYYQPAVKPGYSGVGVITKHKPDKVIRGINWDTADDEGRYLQVDIGGVSVVSAYFPSGSSGETRQNVKFEFLEKFGVHAQALRRKKRQYVLCGDFNIAHKEIDLKNWKSNQKNSGFLPEERAWMDGFLGKNGWVDAFRKVNQEPDQYTWWSNRGQAYAKNVGWRIDYHIVSPGLGDKVKRASIYRDVKFSDHAPLTIDYDL